MQDESVIEHAIKFESLEFLKTIWQMTFNAHDIQKEKFSEFEDIRKRKSEIIHNRKSEDRFNNGKPVFSCGYLIEKFTENKNYNAADHIIAWNGIENCKELLDSLFNNDCFDQIDTLISNKKIYNWPPTKNQFENVIIKEKFQLVLYFLGFKDCRTILNESPMQSYIVEKYMRHGHKMYYGTEMLINIYASQWELSLTRTLCNNILRTIKTKDVLNCHSPILTCLLLCEFLDEIKELSIQYASLCEKVINELKQFCNKIQNSNRDENYLKFLMNQKDSRGRSSFHIASENYFLEVLETPEIGTIVKKMWNGKISNNGFFKASSMYRFFNSNSKSLDLFHSFEKLDESKIYFYQMRVWTDSCSLRYLPETLSTIGLILVYNIFIYFLVLRGQMVNTVSQLDGDLKVLLTIYIVWVFTILINLINISVFCYLTKRKLKNDIWTYIEFLLFIFSLLLLVNYDSFMTKTNDLIAFTSFFLDAIEIPLTKNLGVESDTYSANSYFIMRAVVLSINNILVWLRITGILLTFKQIGPVLRMIYLMGKLLLKYILIFVLFMACCAAVFTAIFNNSSYQFSNFSTSIMTLFSVFQNTFTLNGFHANYMTSGPILLALYICIAGVLFINIIIALLSHVYEQLSQVIDATHRSVLISYYTKYKWDKEYGYLIFLTTPLSILNCIIFPITFFICKKKREQFNEIVCRIYYLLFYFPFFFLANLIYSITIIPFCYLKGVVSVITDQKDLKIKKISKVLNGVKWLFGGLFYLIYIYFRDAYYILKTIFINNDSKQEGASRLKKYIDEKEVIIFLKFIHKRRSTDPHDIHTLFMDYLAYEQVQKEKYDKDIKDTNEYWKKVNTFRHNTKLDGKTQLIYNNRSTTIKSKISSDYFKKNLIIIEILENFLIEEDTENNIDLGKIKKLLPLTTNINDSYIKRLVFTDLRSLNKAVNKLKFKDNVFLQYQLLNKISSTAIFLDKEIDNVLFLEMGKMGNRNPKTLNKSHLSDVVEGNEKEKVDLDYYKEFDIMLIDAIKNVKDIMENKNIDSRISKNSSKEAVIQNKNTILILQNNLNMLCIDDNNLDEDKDNVQSEVSDESEKKKENGEDNKLKLFTIPEIAKNQEIEKNIIIESINNYDEVY